MLHFLDIQIGKRVRFTGTKNAYVYNGDVGEIISVFGNINPIITVKFDSRPHLLIPMDQNELELEGEPKAAITTKSVEVKPTGMNCCKCNFRNDYAEANRSDGTYICFNCR